MCSKKNWCVYSDISHAFCHITFFFMMCRLIVEYIKNMHCNLHEAIFCEQAFGIIHSTPYNLFGFIRHHSAL